MNDQNTTKNEIDLIELFRLIGHRIKQVFLYIIRIVKFLIAFLIRKLKWHVIFCLTGVLFGIFLFSLSDSYFSSEMVIQPNGFSSIDMADYINDIHDLCISGNHDGLAATLQINIESATKIKNIEAYYFIDVNRDDIGDYIDYKNKFDPYDTEQSIVLNRLLIEAEVYDQSILNIVKTGLLNYIQQNSYLVLVNKLKQEELKRYIQQEEKELEKLDSLQDLEYYSPPSAAKIGKDNNQLVFLNEKETQLYHDNKIQLLTSMMQNQKSLELATYPITIIKNFPEFDVEENPAINYVVKSGVIFFILGYFILLVGLYRKVIWAKLNNE